MVFSTFPLTTITVTLLQAFSYHIYSYLDPTYGTNHPIDLSITALGKRSGYTPVSYDLDYKEQKQLLEQLIGGERDWKNFSAQVIKNFGPAARKDIHEWMSIKCGLLVDNRYICYTAAFLENPQDVDLFCPGIFSYLSKDMDLRDSLVHRIIAGGWSPGWWVSQFTDVRDKKDSKFRRLQKDLVYISNLMCMKYFITGLPRPVPWVRTIQKLATTNQYPDPIATLRDIVRGSSRSADYLHTVTFTNGTLPPNTDANSRCFPTIYSRRNAAMCMPATTFEHFQATSDVRHQSTMQNILGLIEYQALLLNDWTFSNLTFRIPRAFSPKTRTSEFDLFPIFDDYADPTFPNILKSRQASWTLFQRMNYGDILDHQFKIPQYGPGHTFTAAPNTHGGGKACYSLDYGSTLLCSNSPEHAAAALRRPSYYQYLEFILDQLQLPVGHESRSLTVYRGPCYDLTPDRNTTAHCNDAKNKFRYHSFQHGHVQSTTSTILNVLDSLNPFQCPELLYLASSVSGCYLGRDHRYNLVFARYPADLATSTHTRFPPPAFSVHHPDLEFPKPTALYQKLLPRAHDIQANLYSASPSSAPEPLAPPHPLSLFSQPAFSHTVFAPLAHHLTTVNNATRNQMKTIWDHTVKNLKKAMGSDRHNEPIRDDFFTPYRASLLRIKEHETANELLPLIEGLGTGVRPTFIGRMFLKIFRPNKAPTARLGEGNYRPPTTIPDLWQPYPGYHILGGHRIPRPNSEKMTGDECILALYSNSTCASGDFDLAYGTCWCQEKKDMCNHLIESSTVYHFKRSNECTHDELGRKYPPADPVTRRRGN